MKSQRAESLFNNNLAFLAVIIVTVYGGYKGSDFLAFVPSLAYMFLMLFSVYRRNGIRGILAGKGLGQVIIVGLLFCGIIVISLASTAMVRKENRIADKANELALDPDAVCEKLDPQKLDSADYRYNVCRSWRSENDYFRSLRFAVRGFTNSEKDAFFLTKADDACAALDRADKDAASDAVNLGATFYVSKLNPRLFETCLHWTAPEQRLAMASQDQDRAVKTAEAYCPEFYSHGWLYRSYFSSLDKYDGCSDHPEYASAEWQQKSVSENAKIDQWARESATKDKAKQLWN